MSQTKMMPLNHNEYTLKTILKQMYDTLIEEDFTFVKNGTVKTIEFPNFATTFTCDGDGIIRGLPGFNTSEKYVEAEFKWYDSGSLQTDFIAQHAGLWDKIKDKQGYINSNYGHLIHSPQNGKQFNQVCLELMRDRDSRRATMVYSNPFIHYTGGDDFICTMYVNYMIREGKLHAFVNMRSNDIRFGLIGADLAWQIRVLRELTEALNNEPGFNEALEPGDVHWHADSFHLYERHFKQLKELFENE